MTVLGNALAKTSTVDFTMITTASSNEGAGSCMLLHVAHAAVDGQKQVYIKSSDSDAVVLSAYVLGHYAENIEEIWIGFCAGKKFQYTPS